MSGAEFRLVLDDDQLAELAQRVARILAVEAPSGTWPMWMSVETAATYLDVSPERVRKLVTRREIPYHQEAAGCRVFFSRPDLDAWMETYRHTPRGAGA
jgi:excisionase family DNA binding protein